METRETVVAIFTHVLEQGDRKTSLILSLETGPMITSDLPDVSPDVRTSRTEQLTNGSAFQICISWQFLQILSGPRLGFP